MRSLLRISVFLLFVLAPLVDIGAADPASAVSQSRPLLSPVFGDHMVLQRGKRNTFWGWSEAGRKIVVKIGDRSVEAVAGPDGRWEAGIDVPPPGGPYDVLVEAGERVTLRDVLVGDVWLCSGQSNMAWSLQNSTGAEEEMNQADQPELRLFSVPTAVGYTAASTTTATWRVCSRATAGGFSAVAYTFGRKLHDELHVPIGLVLAAVGGSPAESWISGPALARAGEFAQQLSEIARLQAQGVKPQGSFLMHWLDEHDEGARNEAWAQPDFDDQNWKSVPVPGGFAELGVPTTPAIAWFRREVMLPETIPAGPAKLLLGVIEKMDTTYVNGKWAGASSWVENPRVYTLPAGALKPGRNVIAIRVFKLKPDGGFQSPAATLQLQLGDGTKVPLAGAWRSAISFAVKPPATLPLDFENYPTMPTVLYHGMIAPLVPLALTGALWYQGEANAARPAHQYRKLLQTLISDWRAQFGQGEFPVYVVSLPAFMARKSQPSTDGWAELREAQIDTVRNVRNTGIAITIDTGEAGNIHPKEKRPVGERLALAALAGHYRRDVVSNGPVLRFVECRPGALALHFDHVEGGLRVRGEQLGEFSVAGEDHVWRWAQARIEAPDVVVVSAPDVPAPAFARYAWQANPLATLTNTAGLPAAPFRTDE